MRPDKIELVGRHRRQAAELMTADHVKRCDCCRADLELVLEDPAGPCAHTILANVRGRIALAEARS